MWRVRLRREVIMMRYICMGLSFWLTLIAMQPHLTTYTMR